MAEPTLKEDVEQFIKETNGRSRIAVCVASNDYGGYDLWTGSEPPDDPIECLGMISAAAKAAASLFARSDAEAIDLLDVCLQAMRMDLADAKRLAMARKAPNQAAEQAARKREMELRKALEEATPAGPRQ